MTSKKREYMKRYHAAHRKERNEYTKRWRAAHPERVAKLNAEHYTAHRKQRTAKQRRYHAAHRVECNARSINYYRKHRAEAAWRNMHVRCSRPVGKDAAYAGVCVCKRWSGPKGLHNFLKDMGTCLVGRTLSRFGDTGDYKPSNCAWHTWKQQSMEHKKKRRAIGGRTR